MKIELPTTNKPSYNYSDLDLAFNIHPIKHDLTTNKDIISITKAIKNLLMIEHYEIPFHPEIGTNIRKMLFELDGDASFAVLEREIADVIKNFEPRVTVTSVNVYYSQDVVMVDISFYLKSETQESTISFPIKTGY